MEYANKWKGVRNNESRDNVSQSHYHTTGQSNTALHYTVKTLGASRGRAPAQRVVGTR